jgi:hypothetical protein
MGKRSASGFLLLPTKSDLFFGSPKKYPDALRFSGLRGYALSNGYVVKALSNRGYGKYFAFIEKYNKLNISPNKWH